MHTRPPPTGPGTEREWRALGIWAQLAALWLDLPSGCDPAHRAHVEQLREACGRALASYRALCEDGDGGALCDHEADPCISRAVLWWVSQGVDVAEAERRVCAVAAWARERLTAPVGRYRLPAWRLPRVLFGDAQTVGARVIERWNAYVAERGETAAQAEDPDFEAAMVALGEREAAEREGRTEDADRAHEEYLRRLALSEARKGGS